MDDQLLVWMDLEMTGLNPERDRILEVACLITDGALNVVAEGPTMAVHQTGEMLNGMDEWNQTHHRASGLWDRVLTSETTEAAVEQALLDFVRAHVGERVAPLCGNSIWQDRRFLARYMPVFEQYLHYRIVDVSTIKELAQRWYKTLPPFEKKKAHTALADIKESIAELSYYRAHLFVPSLEQQCR